jgi:hypothetical protein
VFLGRIRAALQSLPHVRGAISPKCRVRRTCRRAAIKFKFTFIELKIQMFRDRGRCGHTLIGKHHCCVGLPSIFAKSGAESIFRPVQDVEREPVEGFRVDYLQLVCPGLLCRKGWPDGIFFVKGYMTTFHADPPGLPWPPQNHTPLDRAESSTSNRHATTLTP